MSAEKTRGRNLLIVCGLPFAGKSTLGKAIRERFGYEEVDVDETKFLLYGPDTRDEDLAADDWTRIYAETDRLIEKHLRSGKTVIDASRNFAKEERAAAKGIADKAGVPILTIYVDTAEETVRQRLLKNRLQPTRRDLSDSDFEEAVAAMQPPTADENPLVFHDPGDIDRWISDHILFFGAD
jgi:predicted kinase